MPSAGAWVRGQLAAEEIIRQHREVNSGNFPETTAVTLWGLDTIKTRGECKAQIDRYVRSHVIILLTLRWYFHFSNALTPIFPAKTYR